MFFGRQEQKAMIECTVTPADTADNTNMKHLFNELFCYSERWKQSTAEVDENRMLIRINFLKSLSSLECGWLESVPVVTEREAEYTCDKSPARHGSKKSRHMAPHSHILSYTQCRLTSLPKMYAFVLWVETHTSTGRSYNLPNLMNGINLANQAPK